MDIHIFIPDTRCFCCCCCCCCCGENVQKKVGSEAKHTGIGRRKCSWYRFVVVGGGGGVVVVVVAVVVVVFFAFIRILYVRSSESISR